LESLLFLNRQKQFELWRKLFLTVETIGEIYSPDSAVCMDSNSECFYIISSIGSSGEIGEIELNLIPSLIESHRHGTDEGLDSSGRLVVGCSEPSPDVFIIENLHFEGEVFFELLLWLGVHFLLS
jgi:hypothetical protein